MGDVGQVTPVQANIRNEATVRSAVEGADAVINLVGILYERAAQNFDAVQAQGANLVARAAANAVTRSLVHLSATGASATSPSAYARSKAAGEVAVHAAFPEVTILRPSVVFGPHDDFFNRFAAMSQLPLTMPVFSCGMPCLTVEGIKIYGDGSTRFQPVYVGDVAEAAVTCLERDDTRDKVFELGGPRA